MGGLACGAWDVKLGRGVWGLGCDLCGGWGFGRGLWAMERSVRCVAERVKWSGGCGFGIWWRCGPLRPLRPLGLGSWASVSVGHGVFLAWGAGDLVGAWM